MAGNSFSREFLKALGLTDDQMSAIVERHTEVTDALKAQRDEAKEALAAAQKEAAKVPEMQKEIDSLKGGEDWKSKYEKEHGDFENFKAEQTKKEEAKKVEAAYRKLLADEQIKADRHDFIVSHTNLSEAKLDKDGNLENAEALKKEINDSVNGWGAFKVTVKEKKQTVPTPPKDGSTGTGTSRAREIYVNHMKQQGIKVEDAGKE